MQYKIWFVLYAFDIKKKIRKTSSKQIQITFLSILFYVCVVINTIFLI